MKSLFATTKIYLAVLILSLSQTSAALSIEDFNKICDSAPMPCQEVPFLQAYIGGALDLIAMLEDETGYLDSNFCRPEAEFLATTPIIQFLQTHRNERPDRNAMMLVIQYFEENADCR